MRGTIVDLVLYDMSKSRHGFAKGKDGKIYYFNESCMTSNIQITSLHIGDEVSFAIKSSSSTYDIAQHIVVEKEFSTLDPIINYVQPGISSRLDLDREKEKLKPNSGEIEIIKKLSQVLRITRIGYHYMDQVSRYEFCLARASELFKQFIRDSGEFLVIFSHFDSKDWQQKTLKVEKEIRKRRELIERHPLVNFYILISNANELRSQINNVKGEPNAAVIPFSFEELLACNQEELVKCLLDRFAEYYFENNMLGENEAIDDDNLLFGDRGKIADSIVARCHNGNNSGIFGLRRSGKTSVLNAVLRRLHREGTHYVSIESRTYETFSSWKNVLFEIACKVRAEMLGVHRQENETLSDYYARLDLSSTEEEYEKRGVANFIEDIQRYKGFQPLVIAIDEIELITYNTATSQMWKKLESYKGFWSALRGCGCPLVVCGVNSTINEASNITFNGEQCDNPMYGRLVNCTESRKTYLPPFTDEQTKEMINTLGKYSNIAFTFVYHQINSTFGGQPWAVRQFCSFVFNSVKDKRQPTCTYEVSKATCRYLLDEFKCSAPGVSLCNTILQHLRIYQSEYSMLKKIALCPQRHNKFLGEEAISIENLQRYGLIEHDSSTGFVTFNISIIQDFLCSSEEKQPEDMDNNERRRYVQDRIAECERKLKRFLINYYTFAKTDEIGRALFFDGKGKCVIKPHKGVDVESCSFTDFFDHQKFDFYFSKLKQLIVDNWNNIGEQFESQGITQAKFISCMDDLNAGRTDADHYDPENAPDCPPEWEIDDYTLNAFITAYATMKKFFASKNM
ncbi:ATP-binding protein [Gemmiger formicilis]|uniref:ATP-binding protein n=1 Tax=Gemmiger formicilis TaxID=745368 RepID=UPI00195C48A5|nr:ATP-binding protein [Gemmiger formicilis]MBM6916837.1 ATP-binding protein [Gemmiger formicilis]